jgi:hypothetical protein
MSTSELIGMPTSKLDNSTFGKPDDSISISQVTGLCCRYIKSAVESTDSDGRVKRLSDISKELSTARKFKALQEFNSAVWMCLKKMIDALSLSEGEKDDLILTTTKEDACGLAIDLTTELSHLSLDRDYFFESMILDINSLHATLKTVKAGYTRVRHKNELLKSLSKAQRAADVESSVRDAFSINPSLEVDAAKNFIALFSRIDQAQREKAIAEAKMKDMMSLIENQQASIREGELQISQSSEVILDLKRKLAQAKADTKSALEQLAEVETKIENERKMLRSVKESLLNLGKENEDLQDALNTSKEQLRELDSLQKEIFRMERELGACRDAQSMAEQERDKAARYAEEERETRRRCDLHLIESEETAKRLREELGEVQQRLDHVAAQLKGLESDLAHERQWRREWDACHAQVRRRCAPGPIWSRVRIAMEIRSRLRQERVEHSRQPRTGTSTALLVRGPMKEPRTGTSPALGSSIRTGPAPAIHSLTRGAAAVRQRRSAVCGGVRGLKRGVQVREGLQRLYVSDAPGVIDERSHQVENAAVGIA